MYGKRELAVLWIDGFNKIENVLKRRILEVIDKNGNILHFLQNNRSEIVNKFGDRIYNTLTGSANAGYLKGITDGLAKRGITAVTCYSPAYPDRLKETPCPPLALYCKGNVDLLRSDCFAVIGSRDSGELSLSVAERYAGALADAGLTLVTGFGFGADETVLRKGLESGRVISVLAGGFDNFHPQGLRSLFEKLSERALVVSEQPPEITAQPYNYVFRSRIITGLSVGMLAVSGGIKSGVLHSVEYAEESGRDIFAVPYSVGYKNGEGCNEIIKRGGKLTDKPEDILLYYGLKSEPESAANLSVSERKIMEVLQDGEKHADVIRLFTGMSVAELLSVLTALEIKGLIIKCGGNNYAAVK